MPLLDDLKTVRNLTDKGTVTPDRRERINALMRSSITAIEQLQAEHEAMRERLLELEEIHGDKGDVLTWRSSGEPLADPEEPD